MGETSTSAPPTSYGSGAGTGVDVVQHSGTVGLVQRSGTTDPALVSTSSEPRQLTPRDIEKLQLQDKRGLLTDFERNKLETQAAANWDKFYKRNETRWALGMSGL